jgi:transcriptional regulator with XRE-family HTH domain
VADDPEPLDALAARIGRSLRARRTAAGMSIGELARAAGLSKTIIGRIETGAGNPSVETLWRISHALAVPLGELLAEDAEPRVKVVRARTGDRLHADSGMEAWLVHAEGREHRSELFELSLPAGVEQRTDAHLPGTREVVVCVRGRVRAGPLGEEADLGPGDAVWFAADAPHRYVGLRDARALNWVLYGG